MRSFWLGALVGMLIGVGATLLVVRPRHAAKSEALIVEPDAGPGTIPKKRRRSPSTAGATGDQPIPVLTDADRRVTSEGDSLKVRQRNLDLGAAGEPRDLAQAEIDGPIAQRKADIVACVVEARGEAPLSGRVELGLVVGPNGAVTQTRVEAPAYLLKNGLYRCLRPRLLSMRFPAAGKDTIIHVPFDLE